MKCRISMIGGGGLRTLGVIRDWVLQGDVAEDSRVTVMDLDERRVRIVSSLAAQMPEMKSRRIAVDGTTDLGEALEGADFVYTMFRVGGVDGMERDKRIGAAHAFHGHDDFGPSAAMIVLRTAPVILRVAAEMEKRCPDAWLMDFTNPVPYLVRAVADFSKIRVLGFCGGDLEQRFNVPCMLGWDEFGWGKKPCMDIAYRGVGIDHLSWSVELTHRGEDLYPALFEAARTLDRKNAFWGDRMCAEVLECYGLWLSTPFHCYHWTHHEEMLARLRRSIEKEDAGEAVTRSERQDRAMDDAEKCVGRESGEAFWRQEALRAIPSKPGYPAIAMQAIASMVADRGDEIMVNMRAPDAVGNLQDDGIVLISARLFRDGPQPLKFDGVPEGIAPLTRQILDHQKALVQAAVHGNRKDVEVAFLMDPMMRDVQTVRSMLDELLEANRKWIRPELLKW